MLYYLLISMAGAVWATGVYAGSCAGKMEALGVSRVVTLDTSLGQRFGRMQYKEDELLGDHEVVLTFDDGPLPRYTKPILKALEDQCTQATFFYVGKMAKAYPDMLKKVAASGHTIAGHTYSHPLNLRRRSLARAKYEIERGFMTLENILGKPIAPFFRFPGLSDSKPLMSYLRQRGIGMFSVDVISNDSYTRNPKRLAKQTLRRLDKLGRGILLFHDIKSSTARALPSILEELKARGYRVVHIAAQSRFKALVEDEKKLPDAIAKIPKKRWISLKMLTAGPIPLPVKRVAPVAKGHAENGKDDGGGGSVKGEKSDGATLAESRKTAALATSLGGAKFAPETPVAADPAKKPKRAVVRARVKGWTRKKRYRRAARKKIRHKPYDPFNFLAD